MWKNNKNRYSFIRFSRGGNFGSTNKTAKQGCRGITFIELLIAVAIVGILATLSAPSYFKYVQQGRLSDAFATVLNLTAKIEAKHLDNRNYADPAAAGTCAIAKAVEASSNDDFTYSCAVSGADSQQYLLTAESEDKKYSYTLNQNGTRETLAFPELSSFTPGCWHKSNEAGDCF